MDHGDRLSTEDLCGRRSLWTLEKAQILPRSLHKGQSRQHLHLQPREALPGPLASAAPSCSAQGKRKWDGCGGQGSHLGFLPRMSGTLGPSTSGDICCRNQRWGESEGPVGGLQGSRGRGPAGQVGTGRRGGTETRVVRACSGLERDDNGPDSFLT